MPSKPKAKGKGRSPRTRGGSSQRGAMKRASESRSRLKGRILALEGQLSTLRSWVGELHERVTGEPVRAHPEDLDGVFTEAPQPMIPDVFGHTEDAEEE